MAQDATELEIETDRRLQERLWSFQRLAWTLMALLIIAAMLGLTGGGGVFAHATKRSGAVEIEFPQIARWQAADSMSLRVEDRSGPFSVTLSESFSELFVIEGMQPEPVHSAASPDGHHLIFDLGNEPGIRTISFELRAQSPALPEEVTIRPGREPPLSFQTAVLP